MFHVNWFRKDASGKFVWPGFGDNVRVLEWIIARCEGKADADETPIGLLPRKGDLDLAGLKLGDAALDCLLDVDVDGWQHEVDDIGRYLDTFGTHTPAALNDELARIRRMLTEAADAPRLREKRIAAGA